MVVSFGEPSSPTGSVYVNDCGRGEGRIVHTEIGGHDMTPTSLSAKRRSPHQGASLSLDKGSLFHLLLSEIVCV